MHSRYGMDGACHPISWRITVISDKFRAIIEQEQPSIMNIQDLMNCLRICRRTAITLVETKELPAWKDDEKNWCIARSDVIVYIDKNGNA
jgi:hypothetical protein